MPLVMSWGLWWQNWFPSASFERLFPLLAEHPEAIDEVYLFDTPHNVWHATPEQYAQYVEVMRQRFEALRELGNWRLGVFAMTTVGHDGVCLGAPALTVPPMMGPDGAVATAVACPTRPEFHAYIAAQYQQLAAVVPDFVVMADDFRMAQHGPVMWGCFCASCLELFAAEVGHRYSREELWSVLNEPAARDVRKAWVERNARAVESVYATVGRAVHRINPNLVLGTETLPTEFSSYAGSAYERWFTALEGTRAKSDLGYYWDTSVGPRMVGDRMDLTRKAWDTARQTALWPSQVRDRRYELETFPDGGLVKAPETYVNEFAVALVSAGCNGADIQAFGGGPPHDEYRSVLRVLGKAHSYLEAIREHAAGLPSAGLWPAWSGDGFAKRRVNPGESWLPKVPWPGDLAYDPNLALLLAQIGLPFSMRREASHGTVLAGRMAELFDDEELRSILAGGVLIDATVLRELTDRGLGEWAGVRIGEAIKEDGAARMSADPLNGTYADSFINWLPMPPDPFGHCTLVEAGANVRWLMHLEDNSGSLRKGPCMSAYENAAGGRVVVSAFAPWWFLNSGSRRYQMLEVADWISYGRAPVRIEELLPITPYVRLSAQGARGVILLFNTGLSPVEVATVRIRIGHAPQIRLASPSSGPTVERFGTASAWGVKVRDIPAWSTVAVLLG